MKLFIIALIVSLGFCGTFQYYENRTDICMDKCLDLKNKDQNVSVQECYFKCLNITNNVCFEFRIINHISYTS